MSRLRNLPLAVALLTLLLTFAAFALAQPAQPADEYDTLKVGLQPDGRIVVPTNQILKPAGMQVTFPGRPVDMALIDDGATLVVKNMRDLVFIDTATGQVKRTLAIPARGPGKRGFSVVGLVVAGDRIYVSDAGSHVRVARRQADGRYEWDGLIEMIKPKVQGDAHPAGMARLSSDEVLVTSTRGNSLQLLNLSTGLAEQAVQVGVAPYMVCLARPDKCYVSNWGGDPPAADAPQGRSSDTPIRIDPRTGVADHGTISVVAALPGKWQQIKTIPVGLHPSGMVLSPKGRRLYVANANSDTVSVIDTGSDEVIETIACRPQSRLPFGSGSNALALNPRGDTLYVANGTNNCIVVVRLGSDACEDPPRARPKESIVDGLIPTGWYPGAIAVSPDDKKLYVANIKGHGSLSKRALNQGTNSHDHLGSVSLINVPTPGQLAEYTREVNANNRLGYSLAGLEPARADVRPVPVPRRHGEPSVFKHVIYIIKENRTYDQIFGDMKEGNGDPSLTLFGEEVTPNHHALARQFTLFDNFYCSGVLSADGHSWVNEAYVTDYLERAFGGFTRSYPDDGSDPLAYPNTGFLWDNALAHKKTIRNYGEFVNQDYAPRGITWTTLYNEHKAGTRNIKLNVKANLKSLEPYTHPGYPWFPLYAPDAYRADLFIEDLKRFQEMGDMPNLIYLTLPCDHTDGTTPGFPTPRAMVADNDLALGRIVEAVSKSRFWADTCIFVVEDDPQNGFDHVDGHRTVALAISPYTKRGFVDHTNYNQTGMVKTIELILGLPPMNQLDLSATPMANCFQLAADLSPYTCVPNRIALDEMNPDLNKLRGEALEWAKKSLAMNFTEGDAADEDTLNRILWHAVKGDGVPYPEHLVRRIVEEP